MGESAAAAAAALCEECGASPWKYRCPGCSLRSCALACVNSHKRRTGCTGKRSHADVIPLARFDDNLLLSDYKLLEDTKRVAESARRMLGEFRGWYGHKPPTRVRLLRNAAYRRQTRLLILSPGMSKREVNRSRYDMRRNSIFWTIEWRFHLTDIILTDHGIDEHVSLASVIEKHLAPSPWSNRLRPFCDVNLDDLKFFLERNPKGPRSPFRELNIKAPIGHQLANIVIVEYPVIHVFLPSHSYDFDVELFTNSFSKNEEPQGSFGNTSCPKGVHFKEEEREEGEVSENTQVLDLMDYFSSRLSDDTKTSEDVAVAEEALNLSVKEVSNSVAVGLKPPSSGKSGTHLVAGSDRQSTAN